MSIDHPEEVTGWKVAIFRAEMLEFASVNGLVSGGMRERRTALAVILVCYIAAAEAAKAVFYRRMASRRAGT